MSADAENAYVLNQVSNTINTIPVDYLREDGMMDIDTLAEYRTGVIEAFMDLLGGFLRDVVSAMREARRVAHQNVERGGAGAERVEVVEDVCFLETVGRSRDLIELEVSSRVFERWGRQIHRDGVGRAAGCGEHGEAAGVPEQVQQPPSARELGDAGAVVALVEEEARLLPLDRAAQKRDAVFEKDGVAARHLTQPLGRRPRAAVALAAAYGEVRGAGDASEDATRARYPALGSFPVDPQDGDVGVDVHRQPRDAVTFAVGESVAGGIGRRVAATLERRAEPCLEQLVVDGDVGPQRPEPHADRRVGLDEAATEELAVGVEDVDDVPWGVVAPVAHGVVEDPGMAGAQHGFDRLCEPNGGMSRHQRRRIDSISLMAAASGSLEPSSGSSLRQAAMTVV